MTPATAWNARALSDYEQRSRPSKAQRTQAGQVGWPCARYGYYTRTVGFPTPTPELQALFDQGNADETRMLRAWEDRGVRFRDRGASFADDGLELAGRIDAREEDAGELVPWEIKSTNEHARDKFVALAKDGALDVGNALAELSPFHQKWLGQVGVYPLLSSGDRRTRAAERSRLGLGARFRTDTVIDVHLSYEYGETLLGRAETIRDAVRAGKPPDRIKFDPETCGKCPFAATCLPDEFAAGSGLALATDEEFVADLRRLIAIKPLATEYDRLNDSLKARVKATDATRILVTGAPGVPDVIVSKSHRTRKAYQVAATEYDEVRIQALGAPEV